MAGIIRKAGKVARPVAKKAVARAGKAARNWNARRVKRAAALGGINEQIDVRMRQHEAQVRPVREKLVRAEAEGSEGGVKAARAELRRLNESMRIETTFLANSKRGVGKRRR